MENRSVARGDNCVTTSARANDAVRVRASKAAPASTAIKRQLAARARMAREEQTRQKAVAKFQHQHHKLRRGRTAFVVLIAGLLLLTLAALLALNDPRSLRQNISDAVQALSWNDPRGWFPSVEAMRDTVEKTVADALQRFDRDTAASTITPEPAGISEPAATIAAPVRKNDTGPANATLSSGPETIVAPEQDAAIVTAKYRHAARLLGLVAQMQPELAEDPRLRSLMADMQRAAEQEEKLAAGETSAVAGERFDTAGRSDRRDGAGSVAVEQTK